MGLCAKLLVPNFSTIQIEGALSVLYTRKQSPRMQKIVSTHLNIVWVCPPQTQQSRASRYSTMRDGRRCFYQRPTERYGTYAITNYDTLNGEKVT